MSATSQARLQELAAQHGLDDRAAGALACLLELLKTDPSAPTTVTAPDDAVDTHVADSLVALELPVVRAAPRVADLGAGAGFPGLALAAALPRARVDLVEATARKCAFLARAVEAMGLENVQVVQARAEAWEDGLASCDVVCARALAPLAVLVEYAAPLLVPGGCLVAWKGRRDDAEEAAGVAAATATGLASSEIRAVTPFEAAEHRHLHLYLKAGSTPNRFPRRPGMARKRPLGGSG